MDIFYSFFLLSIFYFFSKRTDHSSHDSCTVGKHKRGSGSSCSNPMKKMTTWKREAPYRDSWNYRGNWSNKELYLHGVSMVTTTCYIHLQLHSLLSDRSFCSSTRCNEREAINEVAFIEVYSSIPDCRLPRRCPRTHWRGQFSNRSFIYVACLMSYNRVVGVINIFEPVRTCAAVTGKEMAGGGNASFLSHGSFEFQIS